MKVYALTDLGRKVARREVGGEPEENKVINYLKEYKTGSDTELEKLCELWVVKRLEHNGLVKELTT